MPNEEVSVVNGNDYESDIDASIDRFFESKRVTIDRAEMSEKRFIIKELALASKKTEIVKKLNEYRAEKGLPALNEKFDLYYYQKEYAEIIESISLAYAQNIMKRYRFADRRVRIAKLNDIAESVLDRVTRREKEAEIGGLQLLEEKVHNENIKVLAMLVGAIDEQMGKLKVTTIDVNLRSQSEKPIVQNAQEMQDFIKNEILKKYSNQLPNAVDANFTEMTDYRKCAFAEEWAGGHTHCQYWGDKCKVQAEEVKSCDVFINRAVLESKDQMTKLFKDRNLSAPIIAETAGCKKSDDPKVVERVRKYLKSHDLWWKKE